MSSSLLDTLPAFGKGKHNTPQEGCCIMEAVSYIAGEPWSDHPACVCPVIGTFLRSWNDCLPDEQRDILLRPLTLRLIGTRSTNDFFEQRRARMASDWLIHIYTPAWLRLAGLTSHADALASFPEITDLMPALLASKESAVTARDASWDAAKAAAKKTPWNAAGAEAWDAAGAAAWDAAGAAAGKAARGAARGAAWGAARDAAETTAMAAAEAAAGAAAWNAVGKAARDAARGALKPTVDELQKSAFALVIQMIEVLP